MRYGVTLPNFGPYADVRVLAGLAREAEDAGWDGFFVADHLTARLDGRPAPVAEPWVAMAAIAAATSRVKIGPMVAAVPRRRPWTLASEAATLDHLSGGRLILGVGSGTGEAQSFTPFSEEPDLRRRATMLEESLEVMTGLWRGEPFSFRGEHFQVNEVTFLPKPVQQPRIPIWVAGTWPHKRPFRRAARWDGFFADIHGLDWMKGEVAAPEHVREVLAYCRSQRTADGPFDAVVGGFSPKERGAAVEQVARLGEAGLTWWVEGIHEAFGSADEVRAMVRRGPPG